ncbi:MAG: adenylate/guanylate cyclase domain-containing protein [Kiloniellales bacterium]
MDRRLTAILAADMVGYSRLMGEDEAGTLDALKTHRVELIEPAIAAHEGRVVKLIGDGVLAEFPSVVEAVQCGVEIQRGMAKRNVEATADRRIEFRVGINLGDVIADGDDIYGEGVNIAVRLERIADPGGICIARNVFDQVKGKVEVGFEDMGDLRIKNIAAPVRVYRILPETSGTARAPRRGEEAGLHANKPSVAVLPFTNMSGDPEQEYFSDGITEDVITELARFQNLTVMARNSVFTYKGQAVRVQDVGRDLGVDYVVEGGVRKAGNRVRVTVQLVDAISGNHIWAERYDRDLTDIFELQDELTQRIVATLPGRLESAGAARIKRKPPADMGVYDYVLRAKLCHHRGTAEDNAEAIRLLDRAIELDPEFASAYAWRACTLGQALVRGYLEDTRGLYDQAVEAVRKGLSLDENDLECLRILCEVHMEQSQLEEAEICHERAFKLNPNDPRILAQRGELLTWLGRPEEGAEWVEQAMRLDPYGADAWTHLAGRALFGMRRYEDAIRAYKRVRAPRVAHHAYMAACYAHLGSEDQAQAQAAQVLRMKEDFSAAAFGKTLFYKADADGQHVLDGLSKAGLPE